MKTKIIVIIFTIFGLTNTWADLQPIYERKGRMEESTMVQTSDGQILLIQTETSDLAQNLRISEVDKDKSKEKLELLLPLPNPIYLIRANAVFYKNKIFIYGIHYDSGGHLFSININDKKITSAPTNLKDSLISSMVPVAGGLLIGGFTDEHDPLLELYDDNLKFIKKYKFPISLKGEVNTILGGENPMLLANFSDATAQIYSVKSSQLLSQYLAVNGGAGTFLNLQDGGVIITYRIKETVFIEKLDQSMQRQWRTKLHAITGPTTKIAQLFELNDNIIWIGARNNHLLIYKVSNKNGKILKINKDDKYSIPNTDAYLVLKRNNHLYIHGQSAFSDAVMKNEYASFIFSYGN